MEEEKYWLLMSRYLSNELTLEETTELLNWLEEKPERTELLQQLQLAWDKTAVYQQEPAYFHVDTAWQKVAEKLSMAAQPPEKKKTSFFWFKVAAMLLLALNAGWLAFKYYDNSVPVDVVNNTQEVKVVKLPDNSKVWLNAHSKISYKKGFNSLSKRELLLTGEAFFEVKRNIKQPFIVTSSATVTEVLGTSFNVKNQDGNVWVSVLSGKVSLKARSGAEKLMLLPGETGTFNTTKGLQKSKNADTNFLYWKSRALSFNNERLEHVIAEIEKAYRVKFDIEDQKLLNQRLTATFKNAPVEEVRAVLEALLDRQIVQSVNSYVVK